MAEGSKKTLVREASVLAVLIILAAIGLAASVTVTAPTGNVTGTTNITFTYAGFDANAKASLYFSTSAGAKESAIESNLALSGCASPCTRPWNTGSTTGEYYVDVKVVDDSNHSETVSSGLIKVDNSAPTVVSVTPTDGSYVNNAKPTIEASLDDAGTGINESTIEMKLDNNTVAHTYSNKKVSYTPGTALSQGTHTAYVQAEDFVGNSVEKTWTFTLDSVAPTFTSTPTHNATTTLKKGQTLTVTAVSQTGLTAKFSIDGIVTDKAMTGSTGTYTGTYTVETGDEATDAVVTVKLEDPAGNKAEMDCTSTVTINGVTPSNVKIKINNDAVYTIKRTVTLNISASNSSHCRFKNSGASYGDWLAYVTSKSWTLTSGDGTKTVYMQCANKVGDTYNTAAEVSDSIKLDTEGPAKVTNIKAEAKAGGKIKVTWDDVSSAVKYKLYRDPSSFDDEDDATLVATLEEGDDYGSSADEISYTDDGLSDGKKYYYRVIAYDSSGNKSELSTQVYATAIADCQVDDIEISLPSTVSPGLISISVTTSEEVTYARLIADPPGAGSSTLFSNEDGTEFYANYTVPEKEGELIVSFISEDDFGNECKKFASADIVMTPLLIEFSNIIDGDLLSGVKALKAKTVKGSKVSFYYFDNGGWTLIGEDTTRGSGDTFETSWNTMGLGGVYKIKAVATDSSSNQVTAELNVTIENNVQGLQEALKGLENAEGVKTVMDLAIKGFDPSILIVLPDLNEDFSLALGWINEAEALYEQRNYEQAVSKIGKALNAFADLNGVMPRSVKTDTAQKNYALDDSYEGVLSSYGLASLAGNASSYAGTLEITRELRVLELEMGDTMYAAQVIVRVKNNGANPFDGELVEVIPKDVAKNVSGLAAGNYTVLEEDPVIKWPASIYAGGESVYSYYVLAKEKEINTGMLESYDIPLVVQGTVDSIEVSGGGLAWVASVIGTVIGIGLLAAIILIAVSYFAKSVGSRSSKPKSVRPSPGRRADLGGDLASAARFSDRFAPRKSSEPPRAPKFAYRGP